MPVWVSRRDVVLTGLPRSGTTVACDVLEPFYRRLRRKIRRQVVAISKHVGGEVTNTLLDDTIPKAASAGGGPARERSP
jgi:hypothetical protein